jgi:transcriptional regulator with XRE-family HTH domain
MRWLRQATPEQRARMASLAGTTVGYLYQIAGGHRAVPKADLAFAIEDATLTLHTESLGLLPVVTAREIANAALLAGFDR